MPRTVTLFVEDVPESESAEDTAALVERAIDGIYSVTHLPPREKVGG